MKKPDYYKNILFLIKQYKITKYRLAQDIKLRLDYFKEKTDSTKMRTIEDFSKYVKLDMNDLFVNHDEFKATFVADEELLDYFSSMKQVGSKGHRRNQMA